MLLEAGVGAGADAIAAISSIFSDVSGTFSIGNIASVIGIAIGAALTLVLAWFGVRKVIRIVMAAFRKGKVSV